MILAFCLYIEEKGSKSYPMVKKMRSIEDCIESGRLIPVRVSVPPTYVFEVGDAKSRERYQQKPMLFSTCEANSRCVVEGMNVRGELGWEVVGGFAFIVNQNFLGDPDCPAPNLPSAHVWIQREGVHFDPTKSRLNGEIQDISQNRYFVLTDILPGVDGLDHLRRLADAWGLDLLENSLRTRI